MGNAGKNNDPWNPFSRGPAPEPRQDTTRMLEAAVIEPDMEAGLSAEPDHSRRRYDRIAGPFDGCRVGLLETTVRIYDLSRGGCFVNSLHEQQEGTLIVLKIDLPQEGWITLTAETLYLRPGFGFAVRFIKMDSETESCLERTIHALREPTANE